MASQTASEANRRAGDLYTSTSLKLPKDAKMFQIKSDKPLKLDILPYQVGKGNPFADQGTYHYERTFWVHRGIGPDNASYVCPRETSRGKLPCPICEHLQKLREDPEANEDLIMALKAKRRQLFNVIDVNNPDNGVMIWDISWHLFGQLLLENLEDEEFAADRKNWCEFEGGQTLRLGLKEKTFNKQKFYEVSRIDFVDRKRDYNPDKMLDKVYCLDDVVKVLPYEELKKVFMQTGEDTDGHNKKFRRSDVQQIKEMDEKELQKFVIINDIDVDSDDYPDLEDFQDAVIEKIKEAIDSSDDDKKSGKKTDKKSAGKKGKKVKDEEPEDEDEESAEDEIEEGSKVTWDDDGEERTGTVSDINQKKGTCTIDGDDDETYKKVALSDLTLVKDEDEDEDEELEDEDEESAEIEKGSAVTWTDDDQDDHEGTVLSIKGDKVKVKEGKKTYELDMSELTLAD